MRTFNETFDQRPCLSLFVSLSVSVSSLSLYLCLSLSLSLSLSLCNNLLFFNWNPLHPRLNSHCEAWSYKKKKHKKITAYRKSVQKEPTVKRCQLILDLKPLKIIGQRTRKAFYGQIIAESSCARKETVRKIMQSIRITSRPISRKRKWNQLSQF